MGDLLAQLDCAAGIGSAQQAVGVFAQHTAGQPRPGGKRKAACIHNIRAEIVWTVIGRRGSGMRRCRPLRCCHRQGKLLLHKVPAPRLGNDITLGEQLGVGGFDRDLADAQVGGQLSLARQALAARERAGHDVRAHRAVQLLVERCFAVWIEVIGEHIVASSFVCCCVFAALIWPPQMRRPLSPSPSAHHPAAPRPRPAHGASSGWGMARTQPRCAANPPGRTDRS